MNTQQNENLHMGHRDRLREKYLRFGIERFEEHELLELLLFYAIPRRDTNEIAHRLLNRFGSLSAVLDSSVEELEKVEGIGHNAALLLHFVQDLARAAELSREKNVVFLNTVREIGLYLKPRFSHEKNERVILLCMDGKRKVLSCGSLFEGSFNAAQISVKRVVEIAVNQGASYVVLAHNHPSGVAIPSEQDMITTARIESALIGIGIVLLDHLIYGDNDFISFMESGYLNPRANILKK